MSQPTPMTTWHSDCHEGLSIECKAMPGDTRLRALWKNLPIATWYGRDKTTNPRLRVPFIECSARSFMWETEFRSAKEVCAYAGLLGIPKTIVIPMVNQLLGLDGWELLKEETT